MEEMHALGDVIRRTREQRGWNQRDLAERLGWDNSRLSRLEKGVAKVLPPPGEMHALADVLRVPEARLLEAAGYRVIEAQPLDGITLSGEDPRAEIVRLLADADDDVVLTLVATVRSLLPALRAGRATGGKATA